MRPSCPYCARKHLAQALVLLQEAKQGYPEHRWIAIGHLAEAADELINAVHEDLRQVAFRIREERKRLEIDENYVVPCMDLIRSITDVPSKPGQIRGQGDKQVPPGGSIARPTPNATLVVILPKSEAAAFRAPVRFQGSELRQFIDGMTLIWDVPHDELASFREQQSVTSNDLVIRDHTVAPPIGTPQIDTPPCPPCEEARKKREAALAKADAQIQAQEIEAGKTAGPGGTPMPRLLLITTLGDFSPSYSLTTVILDQAHAAALAGFEVDILVMDSANLDQLPKLPPQIHVRKVVPTFGWKEDVVDDGMAQVLAGVIDGWIRGFQPSIVITHDLLFQSWFTTFAKAVHLAEENFGVSRSATIYHMAHSAPGVPAPPRGTGPAAIRRTLPPGHRLLVCNQELVLRFAQYYECTPDRISVLTNARDIRTFLNVPPLASEIITRLQLHRAYIVQIYPFSLPRWREKGVETLLRIWSRLNSAAEDVGFKAHLVLAVCHADGKDAPGQVAEIQKLLSKYDIGGCTTITSGVWPQTAQYGLSADVIRSLFQVSNLFLFPTWSEAASLILREAALAGCLLVLNDNVPQLKGCIPPEYARWEKWQALGVQYPDGTATSERDGYLVEYIVDELFVKDRQNRLKRLAMSRFSLEEMGEGLKALLPSSESGAS